MSFKLDQMRSRDSTMREMRISLRKVTAILRRRVHEVHNALQKLK